MGKNKQVSCNICYKTMRSDNFKRHMKNKHEKRNEDYPTRKRKLEDEEDQPMIKKKCNVLDDEELERDMINDNEEYNCKLALGEKVYKIVERRKVKKESLSLERKEAFELYRERNVEQLDEKEKEKKDIDDEDENEINVENENIDDEENNMCEESEDKNLTLEQQERLDNEICENICWCSHHKCKEDDKYNDCMGLDLEYMMKFWGEKMLKRDINVKTVNLIVQKWRM